MMDTLGHKVTVGGGGGCSARAKISQWNKIGWWDAWTLYGGGGTSSERTKRLQWKKN